MVMAAKRYGSNPSMFYATPAAAYAPGSTAILLELRDVFQAQPGRLVPRESGLVSRNGRGLC
jgi:hypothetical protein